MGNKRHDFEDRSNIYSDASFDMDATEMIPPTNPAEVAGRGSTVDPHDEKTEPMEREMTEIAGAIERDGIKVTPTVGWLICIKGPRKGDDFHLHEGWNYIGNGPDNGIDIPDPKVSRSNMARIGYDDKGRRFYIAPGEMASNLTYRAGKPLLAAEEICAYDVISVGDTDLMFVPLCGEHFSWEN